MIDLQDIWLDVPLKTGCGISENTSNTNSASFVAFILWTLAIIGIRISR